MPNSLNSLPTRAADHIISNSYSRRVKGGQDGEYADVHRDLDSLRNGKIVPFQTPFLWLHGASIGEVRCLQPLMLAWTKLHPPLPLLFTYTSPDGRREIERFSRTWKGSPVSLFPLFGTSLKEFRAVLNPQYCACLIVAEGEDWARLRLAVPPDCPRMLIDARFNSDSGRVSRFSRRRYRSRCEFFDAVTVNTEGDLAAAMQCARPSDRIKISLTKPSKIDIALQAKPLISVRAPAWQGAPPAIIYASAHHREFEIIADSIAAVRRLHPQAVHVVAPRYLRKALEVDQLKASFAGREIETTSVSEVAGFSAQPGTVGILNSMGELAELFRYASIAVICGSFAKKLKGHSMIEPLACAVPVIIGPFTRNWNNLIHLIRQDETASVEIVEPGLLAGQLSKLLDDPNAARQRGTKGLNRLLELAGAGDLHADILGRLMGREFLAGVNGRI